MGNHLWRTGVQEAGAGGPLNRWLEETLARHAPPRLPGGRAVKFRYATQVAVGPPTITLFTNYPDGVAESYRRYLENQLRETFQLQGTQIRQYFRKNHDDRFG